jgi:hypothetical protein
LELKQHIQTNLLARYEGLMHHRGFVPCSGLLHSISHLHWQQQLDRMLAERIDDKSGLIQQWAIRFQNNWHEVFHVALARGYGMHSNQDVFELLALNTPLKLIQKHRTYLIQLEALAFGQAGFLDTISDEDYPQCLQQEYVHLKQLYQLSAIDVHRWQFMRLRPAGFPTLRLAEWAHWWHAHPEGFTPLLQMQQLKEVMLYFQSAVSDYWTQHYRFGERAVPEKKSTGHQFIHHLIINTVVPFLYTYGQATGDALQSEKALQWLMQLPSENNHIMRMWQSYKVPNRSAADSQALLQLHQVYCSKKRCLQCQIGYRILKGD